MAIERFSSRREALGDVLTARLAGGSHYLGIAGYFRSSLLEVVPATGEVESFVLLFPRGVMTSELLARSEIEM